MVSKSVGCCWLLCKQSSQQHASTVMNILLVDHLVPCEGFKYLERKKNDFRAHTAITSTSNSITNSFQIVVVLNGFFLK